MRRIVVTSNDGDVSTSAWPAPSGPALSPPRGEPDATTSSRLRRAAAGVGLLAVAGIAGATAYGVFHDDAAGGSQQGTSVVDIDDTGHGESVADDGRDAHRSEGDDGDRRGSVGQARTNDSAPQPGRPGPGSQSTSSSS